MRNTIIGLLLMLSCTFVAQTKDTTNTKTEKALAIVPIISSSPLMGLGLGISTSYLYDIDPTAKSKSQLRIGGQYSSTKSYNVFGYNNLWLNENRIRLTTAATYSSVNNEFSDKGNDVAYNLNTIVVSQLQMFELSNNFYLGGPLMYKQINYNAINEAGSNFLHNNGVESERTAGFGLAGSYDTRKNKFYPTNSMFLTARIDNYPTWLGSDRSYHKMVLDSRFYVDGFTNEDVLAMQFYGEYASYYAPDAGLPSISGKSMLRGFPMGQLKARYMTGAQAEYRHTIGESRFRVTGFAGVVNLSGGSFGNGSESRNDDGWYNAVGTGLRYKLQQVTGVDLRLDFVHTSLGDNSVYLKINQAF